MGTRAVSHIWFCWVMNVDSFAVHGTPVVTPVSTFFNSHLANSKLVKPISCQAKLDAFLIIIIISSPAGEALNEESFHFQFTTFSHFREKKKNIPRCSYFLVCATVFIPLIPSSLGLFFILFLLCTTDVFCLSPIFPTQREDKYQREGKNGSMKMPFSFALLSLFFFFVLLLQCIYHTYWMPRWGRPGFATILTVSAYFWQYFLNAYYSCCYYQLADMLVRYVESPLGRQRGR